MWIHRNLGLASLDYLSDICSLPHNYFSVPILMTEKKIAGELAQGVKVLANRNNRV